MDGSQQLLDGIAAVRAVSLTALATAEVVELKRALTLAARRLAAVELLVVAELDQRGAAGDYGCSSTAALLTQVGRLDPAEASGQVRAAQRLSPRRTLGGDTLDAEYPALARAVADGAVSLAHARVITTTIEKLPDAARDHAGREWCEAFLTDQARRFDPKTLGLLARRLSDTLDPDGTLTDTAQRERQRGLTIWQRADGSAQVHGDLTALCSEALLSCLDPFAKPQPAEDGTPDPRTPAQRRHDGLHDALLAALRCGTVPNSGGVAATIQVTMTREQAETASGLALTGHGALIPVPVALSLAGDAQLQVVVISKVGAIEAFSGTQRLFTQAQRRAMAARDQGCSMPGCGVPPAWCQAHHITDYTVGQDTSVNNGTLLCGDHHRTFEARGYTCVMIDNIPHWIPPPWLDPTQTPRRNHAHDPPGTAMS